jgi:hypothetical protein
VEVSTSEEFDMTEVEATNFTAAAVKMTDEELIDAWKTASDEETENLPPLLKAVVDEMARRNIPF